MKVKSFVQKKTILTKENVVDLKKELKELIENERKQVIEDLAAARKQGDLSENAEYDAAREKQRMIELQISDIKHMLETASISGTKNTENVIQIGSKVTVTKIDGSTFEYKIGTVSDINVVDGVISNNSPIAIALIGNVVGATVTIKGIPKPYKLKIKKIA